MRNYKYDTYSNKALQLKLSEMEILKKDFPDAQNFSDVKELAEEENEIAQFILYISYGIGHGVEQDYDKSIEWCDKSSNNGYAKAQFFLSQIYKTGKYLKKNEKLSFELCKKAADQGYSRAKSGLADFYKDGVAVPKNEELAFKFAKMAAEDGDIRGQNIMGFMYNKGFGCKKNNDMAYNWIKKAALQNDPLAQYNLYQVCKKQCIKNGEDPLDWCIKSANNGFNVAQHSLGWMHMKGEEGFDVNKRLGFQWYKKAAVRGYPDAQHNLANCYLFGNGVERNKKEAYRLYKLAAENGIMQSQNKIGCAYRDGISMEKNIKKAIEWFTKSSDQKYPVACKNLAFLLIDGNGIDRDYEKAAELFSVASEAGDVVSTYELAQLYETGHGVLMNNIKAYDLFVKSYNLGNLNSLDDIKRVKSKLLLLSKQNNNEALDKINDIIKNETVDGFINAKDFDAETIKIDHPLWEKYKNKDVFITIDKDDDKYYIFNRNGTGKTIIMNMGRGGARLYMDSGGAIMYCDKSAGAIESIGSDKNDKSSISLITRSGGKISTIGANNSDVILISLSENNTTAYKDGSGRGDVIGFGENININRQGEGQGQAKKIFKKNEMCELLKNNGVLDIKLDGELSENKILFINSFEKMKKVISNTQDIRKNNKNTSNKITPTSP